MAEQVPQNPVAGAVAAAIADDPVLAVPAAVQAAQPVQAAPQNNALNAIPAIPAVVPEVSFLLLLSCIFPVWFNFLLPLLVWFLGRGFCLVCMVLVRGSFSRHVRILSSHVCVTNFWFSRPAAVSLVFSLYFLS